MHPPLPRRLLGSVERLLRELEAHLDDQVVDLAGELRTARTLVGRELIEPGADLVELGLRLRTDLRATR